jgi:tryptophan-rich sensory protein
MQLSTPAGDTHPMPVGRPVTVAALCAVVVAVVGGAMTDTGPWYRGLEKSALTPPDWVFGPAWTVIYALAVVAAVLGWRASRSRPAQAWLVSLFFANAVLNVLWSAAFFTARRPDWALAEVVTLWVSVLALIVFLWPRSQRAGALLIPYLLWVSFAAYLNYRVVVLNGPFA